MSHIDHHSKPYDEGTLNKLEIFSRYVEAWLPAFIMQSHIKEVNIVDFFSGLGYDSEDKPGSPIRTLEKIDKFFGLLMQNNTIINLYLNEFKYSKYEKLIKNCNTYLEENSRLKRFVKIYYSNKDFNEIYNEIIIKTQSKPNLYIIDQSGIKFTNQENFNTLLNLEKTDFLFFISSSFFKRFNKETEFNRHLNINEDDLNSNPYNFIHRIVLDKYRSLIPKDSTLKIFPFSIKKNTNIYGIIFGSKHILGVDKFLKIVWDKNKINGEADYDIDDDKKKGQIDLFEGQKLTKIESFKQNVENLILNKNICNNSELLEYVYSQGHIPKHAADCLKQLKKEGKISYDGKSPLVTYDNVHKNKKSMFYKILNQ